MQAQAYRLKAGKLSHLQLTDIEVALPAPHEVQIEVKAIGLNFADLFAIWGLYQATPQGEFTPGLEYAGEVIAVGEEVTSFQAGDRVMGVTRFGAYTTHLNIDAGYVIPLPKAWIFEEGAGYLVQVLTAYYGLIQLGDLQDEQTVLIHSAAGGVGIWANRIAKQHRSYTIGTVGRPDKVDFCYGEGYNEVILRDQNFKQQLTELLGNRELKIVMECIGGDVLRHSFDALAPMGRMIVYGSARYATSANRPNFLRLLYQYLTRPKIDPQNMTNLNKSVMAFNLIFLYDHKYLMHQILHDLAQMDLGKPHVGHTFRFAELPNALKMFQTGNTIGKVVVTIS